jgi:alkylhydroperoxidase family enzyme
MIPQVAIFPDAMRAHQALGKVAHNSAVPLGTLLLVELRASQVNGCSVCVRQVVGAWAV